MFILLSAIFLYTYISVDRIYKIESMIKIEEESGESLLLSPSLSQSNINLEQEIVLYLSKTNVSKLVSDLKLDVVARMDEKIISVADVIDFEKYNFKYNLIKPTPHYYSIVKEADGFSVFDNNSTLIRENARFGDEITDQNGVFVITRLDIDVGKEILLSFYDKSTIVKYYVEKIYLNEVIDSRFSWEQGNLLSVSYNTSDVKQGIEIVNKANNIFLQQDIQRKSTEADKSLVFIDEQLASAKDQLEESEIKLSNFQKEFGTLNVNLEIEGYIDEIAVINEKIRGIQIRRVELESRYSSDNITIQSLQSQESELLKQLEQINEKIELLPKTQQEYVNLYGDVEINKNFYQELMAKKLEVSIIKASTLGRVEIIDQAYLKGKIFPSGRNFLALFLGIYSVLAAALIYIRTYYFNVLKYPSAVLDLRDDLKITGVISELEDINDKDELYKNFETTCSNILLDTKNTDSRVIQISGPTEQVGKSTVAINISRALANLNKKVLLLDFDYKKGKLHETFDVDVIENMDIFSNLDLMENFKINENLYFIPRRKKGSKHFLPFIESNSAKVFFEEAKKKFDFIIIDTTPMLNLVDAVAVTQYADLLYLVCRHNKTMEKEIKGNLQLLDSIDMQTSGIVYNAFKEYFGNYYYYSDYDYKYDYAYKYEYGEDEKN